MEPAQSHDDNSKLDGLVAQYLEAVERGEQPDRKHFLQQYPDIAIELQAFFADLDKVEATKLQAQQAPDVTFIPQHESKPGAVFGGRYKLLENIGEGGMGSVWVAEQQQPVKRRVAIKLVKAGMDSKQVLARFEAERQALAVMDHPNIAKVFDGGMTEQGRPYFVMEYVKGVPFTEYCDKARLSLRERLNLFIPVCQAVQHAHHKGIVHRDLKPSNILICLYDGKPVPKVIDFGLAKAMHQSLTDQSIYTGHGIMVGTPLYMSPEQAEHNNLDVDTRTDIYSLGVVLYELLVGTTPLERQQLQQAAFEEVLRLIKEVEPPRPSLRLSTSASLPSIAAQRSIDPKQLSRSVAGDLDWIVMKSLEKERSRRYDTANGLARDIERFLNDEAVEACPPSRAYRLKKFLRKHRGQVIAASAVLLALIVGILGTTWGLIRATTAENAAKESEKKAIASEHTALSALEEVEKERDAKEVERQRAEAEAESARVAKLSESEERANAERQLANGILRPIGFNSRTLDPAEIQSLEDWANLNSSRLRLHVLESVFEDPATALRLAMRAERVIQACVALSPARRAKAIELVSTKQRDMNVDPRIRVAACWLAMELGSADIPALEESVRYLSDSSDESLENFAQFMRLALQNRDPEIQKLLAQRLPEVLYGILENSTNQSVLVEAQRAIASLAPNIDGLQAMKAWHSVIHVLDRAIIDFDEMSGDLPATNGAAFAAISRRLNSNDNLPAWRELIAAIRRMNDEIPVETDALGYSVLVSHSPQSAELGLIALVPQLAPGEVNVCWIDLIDMVRTSKSGDLQRAICRVLTALAPRLSNADIQTGWVAMFDVLATSTNQQVQLESCEALSVLASQLEATRISAAFESLLTFIETTSPTSAFEETGATLAILAPRLEPESIRVAWDRLVRISDEKSWNSKLGQDIGRCLSATAPNIPDSELSKCWDTVLSGVTISADGTMRRAISDGIIALLPRVAPENRGMAIEATISALEDFKSRKFAHPGLGFGPFPDYSPLEDTLVALAPYLKASQVSAIWTTLIQINDRQEYVPNCFGKVFRTLGPHLGPMQISTTFDHLIEIQTETPYRDMYDWSESVFWGIAAQLDATKFGRSADELRTVIENSTDRNTAAHALKALQERLPHLSSANKTRILNTAKRTLESSNNPSLRKNAIELMVAATVELGDREAGQTGDVLIRVIESSEDADVQTAAANGLAIIAIRLDRSQRSKACDAYITLMENSSSDAALILSNRLSSMLQQLEVDVRPLFEFRAMELLLEFNLKSSRAFHRDDWPMIGPFETYRFGLTTKTLSDPQAIARLLSHPGCINEPCDLLLQRFEELALHEGKHVFLTMSESDAESETLDAPTPLDDLPPRKLRTLDAAAAWIQQNWPDFDLDATHPVTWRGER